MRDWISAGSETLSPADALAGMAELMVASSAGRIHGVVARIDWARFLPLYQLGGQAVIPGGVGA